MTTELWEQRQAEMVAEAMGGEAWQSGGDIWLVLLWRQDGRLVVISGDVICEYENETAFDEGNVCTSIRLY